MENGLGVVNTPVELGDKDKGLVSNEGDEVFEEAIGTTQKPDLGNDDGFVVNEESGVVGFNTDEVDNFEEAIEGEVANAARDNLDSSISSAAGERRGDEGDDVQGTMEEEEVVSAFLDMEEQSDLSSEVVQSSGVVEADDADSVVPESADSNGRQVTQIVDSDGQVANGRPLPESADSDGVVANGRPVPENAEISDSSCVVFKETVVPESTMNTELDCVFLKGTAVRESAENGDSDREVSKETEVLDSAENGESECVVLKESALPESAENGDSEAVPDSAEKGVAEPEVLKETAVPDSAEKGVSEREILKETSNPDSAEKGDSEREVLKATAVPETADILLKGETNGETVPQGIGKSAEPEDNDLSNAYRKEETVDHTGKPHMEIQDDLDSKLIVKSDSTETKHEATESKGEKGAETVLHTGHQSENVTLNDLPHNGKAKSISAVSDISKEKKTDSPNNVADAGSSSLKSTTAAVSLPSRPAGLGRAAPLLEPAHRVASQPRANGTVSHLQAQQAEEANGDGDEYDETREKLQMIRVKFLRLAHRLGQTPHNVVVAQVLYRLGLAEQLRGSSGGRVGAFSFDRASAMAEQLEAAGQDPLDFSCTIMVLGKSGVGKSATVNSLFDEPKFTTDAFQMGTRKVQDVVGTVQGIKVRVIDTPGLLPSWCDQQRNEKILQSVKRFIKKTPPDIVLYLDRLDMQSRDLGDMPLLRTITEIFGPSIWFNAIVVLTHAASAPPDGPNGTASSYDMFVTQRSHVVQQAIRQAAGDMRLMNPVSLVENHSACRTNRAGQRVLPNGQVWKPHLLLLSFASKILAEANALLKLQDSPPGKPFVPQSRAPPLPFLLSSLLQSRPPLKLPEEQQYSDEDGLDDDLGDSSDSDNEMDYDDLPPFKSLSKSQLVKLNKDQKKAYFEELEYREKLLMKKQLKEERKRRKMMKKMAAAAKNLPSEFDDNGEEESSGAASVPVLMSDLALPASFDSDNPTHRYRYLDTSSPWLMRPVLDTNGWDHDVGYEGINVERLFVVKERVPVSLSSQVTKDKKDSNVQIEVAGSLKHGRGKSTSLGFDMQSVGKDLAYTLRSETMFSNYKKNKASAGLSLTLLGDILSAGLKLENKLNFNKRFQMVVSGGAMSGRGDVAYGGSLEAQLRDKDYPLGRSLSTLGLSIMDWHGDLAIGCNLQSQIPVGRSTNLIARGNLNNRGAGQVSVRLNSSEQLQLVLLGLIPLLRKSVDMYQQQFGQ